MHPSIRGGRPPPPLGLVLYQGRSKLDGKLIVAVATGFARPSCNTGTGPQVQTWILRADITPTGAVFTGEDRSVCGDCPHRGGACYVTIGRAPQQVFHSFRAGRYPKYQPDHLDLFRRRPLRLGSYGDPAAVPTKVWRPLCQASGCWTGFTHRWKDCDPQLREFLMASVDTPAEFHEARALGWKPFRVRLPEEPLLEGEFVCPKSAEGGYRLTCLQCGACKGGEWSGQATPAVVAHGGFPQTAAYRRFRQSLPVMQGPASPPTEGGEPC